MAIDVKNKKDLEVKIIRDSQIWNYLPSPENIIRGSVRGLRIYDDMKEDARVGSLFEDRRNATSNLPCYLTDVESGRVNDYASRHLTEAEIRKWAFILLDGALTYGFQPAEIIWERDRDGFYYIAGLDIHDINRYRFNTDGELFYDTLTPLNQPYKWIVHRNEGDSYNRQYGRAYLRRVYWPWKFKTLGWQFWLTATEKFSVPSLVVLFEQSDPKKAKETADNLADLILSISSGSGGAFANVNAIQQLSMGGSVADFSSLITACDLQISYGMTGQALATNVSETGTQALGTVQERTKNAAYENDARALRYTLQKLVDYSIAVNFGEDEPSPVFSFDTEDKASFDEVLRAYQAGIPISRKAMYAQYGLPEPEDEEDELEAPASASIGAMGTAFNFSDDDGNSKKKLPMILLGGR